MILLFEFPVKKKSVKLYCARGLNHLLCSNLRRFSFFGTMERHGTERNGTMNGTVRAENERNGIRNGTVQAQNKRSETKRTSI